MSGTLFVFYTLDKGGNWTYKLPKGWNWTGTGTVNAMNSREARNKFEREEQFNGDKKTQTKTREYLDAYFSKLKDKNFIKFYKIRSSYLP